MRGRRGRPFRRRTGRIATAGVLAGGLALAAPAVLSPYWTSIVILVLILGLFALSHDLLIGHTGLVSLGHVAFFGMSAYTAALLQTRYEQPVGVALAGGFVAAILLGAVLGFSIRTKGIYFILLTMALGIIFWGTAQRWTALTRGESGISGVRLPVVAGIDLGDLSTYYYLVVTVTVLCVLAYSVLVASPFGLTLRGIRESESRMRALGYRVGLHKYAAFVLSATMAGIAGLLYAYYNNFISPASTELLRAAEAVLAVVIGGSATVAGPFIGAAIITVIRQELSAEVARYMTVMGVIFIVTAMYASDGLVGRAAHAASVLRRRRLLQRSRAHPGPEEGR